MNNNKTFETLKKIFKRFRFSANVKKTDPAKSEKKSNPKNKFGRRFLAILSLALASCAVFQKSNSLGFLNDKAPGKSTFSVSAPLPDGLMPNSLSNALGNIFCVVKSYPTKLDNVGIIESNVMAFKYHLSNFIEDRFGIKSDKLINNMVTGCERLYRFLADKKNYLCLKQQRSINNLSEQDLYYIKKINNILIDHFKTYKEDNISPYLSDESPELTIISITLYCFASDENLNNPDEFINNIFTKSDASDFLKGIFVGHIRNILNINATPMITPKTDACEPHAEKIIQEKVVKVAVIPDEGVDTDAVIKCLYAAAENKKIKMHCTSANGNKIYRAEKVCTNINTNLAFTLEFTIVSDFDPTGNEDANSPTGKTLAGIPQDVIAFVFDKNKYTDKNSNKLSGYLNKVARKLKSFAPQRPIIFVPNNSSHLMYEKICDVAL